MYPHLIVHPLECVRGAGEVSGGMAYTFLAISTILFQKKDKDSFQYSCFQYKKLKHSLSLPLDIFRGCHSYQQERIFFWKNSFLTAI